MQTQQVTLFQEIAPSAKQSSAVKQHTRHAKVEGIVYLALFECDNVFNAQATSPPMAGTHS